MALDKDSIIEVALQNISRNAAAGELTTEAESRLNLLLQQIYLDTVSDFLSKQPAATITLTAGLNTFTLPTDYLKFLVMTVVRTDQNPTQPPVLPVDKIEWSDFLLLRTPSRTGAPQVCAINRSTTFDGQVPVGYVYPTPDKAYTCMLGYYYMPDFDISGASVPVYPDQHAIVDLLTNSLYQYVGDPRYDKHAYRDFIIDYRRNQADSGIYPTIARLDKRRFKPRTTWRNIFGFPDNWAG